MGALTSLTLNAQMQWVMQHANTSPFGVTQQGSDSQSFSLDSIDLTAWTNLYTRAANISPSLSAPTSPSATAAAGGSLSAGTFYYKITATGGAGVTGETTGSAEVNATTSGGNLTINLSWTASAHASGYNVYRGTGAGAENLLIASNVAGTSYSDTGAAAGTSASVPGSNTTGYDEFSLLNWTNLVNDTVSFGHALTLVILPGSGGQAVLGPGTTNGLTWFFGGTTPTISLPISGFLAYSLPVGATGQVVDSTHNTLRITNNGTTNHTSTVLILGGP